MMSDGSVLIRGPLSSPPRPLRHGFSFQALLDRDFARADDQLRRLGRVPLDDALDPVGPQLVPGRVAACRRGSGEKVGQILFAGTDSPGAVVADLDEGSHRGASTRAVGLASGPPLPWRRAEPTLFLHPPVMRVHVLHHRTASSIRLRTSAMRSSSALAAAVSHPDATHTRPAQPRRVFRSDALRAFGLPAAPC